jgi:hypothetical protein
LRDAFGRQRFSETSLDDIVKRFLRVFFLAGAIGPQKNMVDSRESIQTHPELARRVA